MRKNNPDRWHFTLQTNANGYVYVYAYQTAWDPVKKKSRRTTKKYVGRLYDDGRVDVSPTFAALVPAYAEGEFYYGANKTLVDEASYLQDFPRKPGPAPAEDDEPEENELSTQTLGLSWAAEELAGQAGILQDLKATFGEQMGRELFNFSVYKLDEGHSMAGYEDWRRRVHLRGGRSLSGQRISEILGSITQQDFEKFFQRRHARKLEEAQKNPSRSALRYALDNTAISTYSQTIADAAYGHAKRDPELAQINYTFVCDQDTGDIVFAHAYEGSINDSTALQEILYRMKQGGFDLSNVVLVTDRGYSTIMNVQKMINLEINFIQGVRIIEDSVKQKFDSYRESLCAPEFYSPKIEAYARDAEELWAEDREYGQLSKKLALHLYRFPASDEQRVVKVLEKCDEILDLKHKGRKVPPALWQEYGGYVWEIEKSGKKKWQVNYEKVKSDCKYAGLFAIRSNIVRDPIEAMQIYQMRNTVEVDFNQLKNWVDGDRLRCTETSYLGKLFILTLAASIRLTMLQRVRKNEKPDLKAPHNSIDGILGKLRCLLADKRPNAHRWVSRTCTKKQRDMFALLGVPVPPRVLR